jgi:hypothetical protein
LQNLRKYSYPGRVILGGPQVSYVTRKAELEKFYPTADVFVRGYAEDAMSDLMLSPDMRPLDIKGVHCAGEADLCMCHPTLLSKTYHPLFSRGSVAGKD